MTAETSVACIITTTRYLPNGFNPDFPLGDYPIDKLRERLLECQVLMENLSLTAAIHTLPFAVLPQLKKRLA